MLTANHLGKYKRVMKTNKQVHEKLDSLLRLKKSDEKVTRIRQYPIFRVKYCSRGRRIPQMRICLVGV